MELRKISISCILTAFIIIIETLVVIKGEGLVILTLLSTVLVYIIARIKPIYCIVSYFCISILLLIIDPHQMLFFTLLNGILGLYLGTSQSRNLIPVIKIFFCWIILSIGLSLCLLIIGSNGIFIGSWFWIAVILMLCFGYASFLYWTLPKLYTLFTTIYKNINYSK